MFMLAAPQVLYHDSPGAGPVRYQRRKTGGTFG